jgi:hypothetical protein
MSFVAREWDTAYINTLPDSAFALVVPGEKDKEGRTVPRTNRNLPYKDRNDKVDLPHLRNAMARVTHTNLSKTDQKRAHDTLLEAYKKLGLEHPKCSVSGCKGYTQEKKGMLEDVNAFRSWHKGFLRAQDDAKKELSLREKLEALMEQRRKLETESSDLWQEQQRENKPIDEKYNEKRKQITLAIEKLSAEIDILKHAIGEEIGSA